MSTAKLGYGDSVRTLPDVPFDYRPRERGWVCGIREVLTESQAAETGFEIGVVLYIVEFEDGASLEMPGEYLARVEE